MLEPLIARFAALCQKVSAGRYGQDFCASDPDGPGWKATPLEAELRAAIGALIEGLSGSPSELDGAGVTRILLSLRQAEPARDTNRADVGFGYTDFDSPLCSPLWDVRGRLRDSVEKQRSAGVDALSGADPALLEANNGEFLTLLSVPSGERGRAKFRFTLDKLSRLAREIDPATPEACASVEAIAECLKGLHFQLDWDVLEPGRMHYSDSGYEPSTHLGDRPNPDNLLWFFDPQALDQILWAMLACTPLIAFGVRTGEWKFMEVRREAAQLACTLKASLAEMARQGRKVLEGADRARLDEKKNGFARSYGDFLEDGQPGVLAQ